MVLGYLLHLVDTPEHHDARVSLRSTSATGSASYIPNALHVILSRALEVALPH